MSMRQPVQAISFSTVILANFLSGCHNRKPDPAQALAEKVAAMGCFSSNIEADLAEVGERLDRLRTDESANADKALVMLMSYYLGEHNDEQRDVEIVRRGERMRPLLEQAQQHPITISTCASAIGSADVRERAKSLLTAIDHGEHWDR